MKCVCPQLIPSLALALALACLECLAKLQY